MTLDEILTASVRRLQADGITTARLDCLVLLEDILNTDRTQILAHPERHITEVEAQSLARLVERRAQHVPLAYLRGKTEFYGREFIITEDVLEPRPESETMIELLQQLPAMRSTIIDVGTGSGALAITAKLTVPSASIYGIDIDKRCLAVAARNAKMLQTEVTFIAGDLLSPLLELELDSPLVLLCNLPYVPDDFQINTAALHEPRLAIFGGPDGLDLYRQLFSQATTLPQPPAIILTEAMPPQHEALYAIARQAGYQLDQAEDFIQCFTTERS